MPRIARCVCTDRTFADLCEEARDRCLDLEGLCDLTSAGRGCGLCKPYLRRALQTGQMVFDEILTEETVAPAPEIPPAPTSGPVVLSWSGGKDSTLALHRLRNASDYEVTGLLTVLSAEHRRISHHGVREELLDIQAEALGLPLHKVWFPSSPDVAPTMAAFDTEMGRALADLRATGVSVIAHGDIYLEDLRRYRERRLQTAGMHGVFPLWGAAPTAILDEFVGLGYRAVLTAVNAELGAAWAGAVLDETFAARLPAGIDPCGENGEYHSFVYTGPAFREPIAIETGEVVDREGRTFIDLIPSRVAQ